jgi:hypothetical protein
MSRIATVLGRLALILGAIGTIASVHPSLFNMTWG